MNIMNVEYSWEPSSVYYYYVFLYIYKRLYFFSFFIFNHLTAAAAAAAALILGYHYHIRIGTRWNIFVIRLLLRGVGDRTWQAQERNIKRRYNNNNNNNKGYKHRICQDLKRVVQHKRNHNSLEERYRFTCIFVRIYGLFFLFFRR